MYTYLYNWLLSTWSQHGNQKFNFSCSTNVWKYKITNWILFYAPLFWLFLWVKAAHFLAPPSPFSFFINPQNDLFPSNFAREIDVDPGPL